MIPLSLSKYLEDLREVIFDLDCHGLSIQANRLNRVVFEDTWPSEDKLLREVSLLLGDCRGELEPGPFRDRLGLLETLARNHRRLFEGGE